MKSFPKFAFVLLFCSLAFGSTRLGEVRITTASPLPGGTVGSAYSVTIQTAGGEVPFVWSSEGLPSGLTLTPSSDTRSATLAGTPTQPSTLSFDISVRGHGGHVSAVDYALTIDGQGGSHSASLTWNAGASNIIGYNVYRGTTSGGPYSQINSSLLSATNYSDSTVDNGMTYYYVATEVNNEGEESGYSNQTTAVIP